MRDRRTTTLRLASGRARRGLIGLCRATEAGAALVPPASAPGIGTDVAALASWVDLSPTLARVWQPRPSHRHPALAERREGAHGPGTRP